MAKRLCKVIKWSNEKDQSGHIIFTVNMQTIYDVLLIKMSSASTLWTILKQKCAKKVKSPVMENGFLFSKM